MELIAGVDEAGRGALAGPVVSSAVILPKIYSLEGLNDSKLVTPKKREKLYSQIKEQAISIGIGISTNREIDKVNILQATFLSMQRALGKCNPKPVKALIDGKALPNQIIRNEGIINGDAFVPSIQAASIIAKVTRDNIMVELNRIFPEYGFSKHKGYGTKKHMDELKTWKSSPIHRFSFKPVKRNKPSIQWYTKNNKIGWIGEKLAGLHLQKNNHKIIKLNEDCTPFDKIDIISQKSNTLFFSQVQTLVGNSFVNSARKTNRKESLKIKKAINHYLTENSNSAEIRLNNILVRLYKGKHIIEQIKGVTLG